MSYHWRTVVYYRSDDGIVKIEHDLEELHELHRLVKSGPHWDTIAKIKVFRVDHVTVPNLTVERSEEL